MSIAFTVGAASLGTSEADWLGWPLLASLPPMDWGGEGPVVVVAPHPDDEVLGAGGSAALLAERGGAVEVVAVTDGEAAGDASVRRQESADALGRLGLGEAPVRRLGLPDGAVAEVEDELTAVLTEALQGANRCLAPWRGDGHPDHAATGRAAARACATTGTALAEYLVWAWHWATPRSASVPWERAHRVELGTATTAAKRWAVGAFRSQLDGGEPVLPEPVVARFLRPFEVLLVSPSARSR